MIWSGLKFDGINLIGPVFGPAKKYCQKMDRTDYIYIYTHILLLSWDVLGFLNGLFTF